MFRLKTHSRRAMAASLLVVFLNVIFGQVVCALAMPATAPHEHQHEHHHEHPAGAPVHQHGHQAPHSHEKESGATARHQHHEGEALGSRSHKHSSKGSCCQDDAAAVWASLAHPPKAGIEKMAFMPVALPPAPVALVVRFQQWDRTRPVLLVARRQLKPKIPDIRIFIQSLTV